MSEQNKYSLKLQLEAFDRNEWVDDNNRCFYFYDWFCRNTSLERKAKSLIPKVKKFIDKMKIDLDKTYVFFKNNCPGNGSLYDDFRICDRESGDVIIQLRLVLAIPNARVKLRSGVVKTILRNLSRPHLAGKN